MYHVHYQPCTHTVHDMLVNVYHAGMRTVHDMLVNVYHAGICTVHDMLSMYTMQVYVLYTTCLSICIPCRYAYCTWHAVNVYHASIRTVHDMLVNMYTMQVYVLYTTCLSMYTMYITVYIPDLCTTQEMRSAISCKVYSWSHPWEISQWKCISLNFFYEVVWTLIAWLYALLLVTGSNFFV